MKIIMTLYVRNEEDIIQHNIEFHKAMGVDFFIATDNLSQDNTRNILKEYEKKGILKYGYSDDNTHSQFKYVTRMAREAYSEYRADWVINNDADEFWYPRTGMNLKDVFRSIPNVFNSLKFRRSNFVPVKLYSPPFYKRMIFKQEKSVNWLGRPLSGKVAHRGHPNVSVHQGNHSIDVIKGYQRTDSPDIEILHFPARSFPVFANKVIAAGKAYQNNTILKKTIGCVIRSIYKEYVENGNFDGFYNREYYSGYRIIKELLTKNIIADLRLHNFLNHLYKNSNNMD